MGRRHRFHLWDGRTHGLAGDHGKRVCDVVRGAAMARCRTEWRLEDRRIVVSVIQLCGAKGSAGMPGQVVL